MYGIATKQSRENLQQYHQTRLQSSLVLPMEQPRSDRFLKARIWMDLSQEIQRKDVLNFNSAVKDIVMEEMLTLNHT